jgi:hypothetical protein
MRILETLIRLVGNAWGKLRKRRHYVQVANINFRINVASVQR